MPLSDMVADAVLHRRHIASGYEPSDHIEDG